MKNGQNIYVCWWIGVMIMMYQKSTFGGSNKTQREYHGHIPIPITSRMRQI